MFAWLEGPGESFKYPLPGSTNYLSAYDINGRLRREGENTPETPDDLRPFPLNKHFFSEPILSQELREEIWRRVQVDKKSVRTVSVELGVEMRRVGAVVRLMEVEKRMKAEVSLLQPSRLVDRVCFYDESKSISLSDFHRGELNKTNYNSLRTAVELPDVEARGSECVELTGFAQGKALATPYARAVHSMVPTTPYSPGNITPHEPINDLPIHPLTETQLFYPTSESRAFTRTDAGRVFSGAPRLVDEAQDGEDVVEPWQDTRPDEVEILPTRKNAVTSLPVLKPADARIPHPHLIAYAKDRNNPEFANNEEAIRARYAKRLDDDAEARAEARRQKIAKDEAKKTRIETPRWQFVITDVKTSREEVGHDGRGKGVGYRYGVPFEDRKKGQVKIPTKVEV